MSRKRKVLKLHRYCVKRWDRNEFQIVSGLPSEDMPIGRVALSLKKGVKRKMVSGEMVSRFVSNHDGSHDYDFYFIPSSDVQWAKLVSLL